MSGSPAFRIALQDVPDGETLARLMQRAASELAADFPSILNSRLSAEKSAAAGAPGFEVHVELLFPQHQIILNRSGRAPEAALEDALAAVRLQIERLALKDPSVAPGRQPRPQARSMSATA